MSWIQPFISLFTVGGKPNPVAIVLLIITLFSGLFGFHKYQVLTAKLAIKKDCEIVRNDSRQQIEAIKEANGDKDKVNEAIRNDTFDNDFLKRLQLND